MGGFAVFLLIVLLVLIFNIRIVPQAHEFVVELLGKYRTTWSAGIHIKIPLIERRAADQVKVIIFTAKPGVVIGKGGAEVEVIFANNPRVILDYTKNVLNCDIHTRARTKRILLANGAERVCGLDDILTASVNGSGFNSKYGLLGSNKSTEETRGSSSFAI